MRGNEQHEFMIQTLKAAFEKKRFKTATQVHIRSGSFVGFVDLVVEDHAGNLLCVEVEQESNRIANDYVKKELIGAVLWVVVPTTAAQQVARRFIQFIELPENDTFAILTYDQAQSLVTNLIPFSFQALQAEK